MENAEYRLIFSLIQDEISRSKSRTIGISGAYTSGKTIFTEGLAEYLNLNGIRTQLIHYDDFHKPLFSLQYETAEDEINIFYNEAFDSNKLLDDVLAPLSQNYTLNKIVKGLNWASGQYENDIVFNVDENTVVLIEGMLLFREPLINYFDYLIYLDVDEETILDRGEIRDVPKSGIEILDKYKTRYLPVLRRYLIEDDPLGKANIVINNNNYREPQILSLKK